jgi:hypothetical protein
MKGTDLTRLPFTAWAVSQKDVTKQHWIRSQFPELLFLAADVTKLDVRVVLATNKDITV